MGPAPATIETDVVAAAVAKLIADNPVGAAATHSVRARPRHPVGQVATTTAVPLAAPRADSKQRRVPRGGCAETVSELPQGVAVTYWNEEGDAPGGQVTLRVSGVRVDIGDATGPRERFDRTTTVSGIPDGVGRYAATTRIDGIGYGRWDVTATRTDRADSPAPNRTQRNRVDSQIIQAAYGPAVRVWSWPLLVGTGAIVAIVLQGLLLSRAQQNVPAAVGVSLLGCILGFAGAKAWYLVLHRKPLRRIAESGACIQGFLLVSLAVLAAGGAAAGIGVGTVLDATTPGLFLAMAIGRPGCFFTGCCAGRPTASRWGLWSSDRQVAVRRVPIQLWEAAAALLIGAAALTVTLTIDIAVHGAVFVGALAAYTSVRQLLFPFRADPHTRRGRQVTIAVCVLVLALDIVLVTVW